MKKFLVIAGLLILAAYVFASAVFFKDKPTEQICSQFEIVTDDDSVSSLIDVVEIEKFIDSKGLNPYGKQLKEINTYEIEEAILTNEMVKKANVYLTSDGGIRVVVKNRKPVLRVIANSGESYYIDREAEKVPLSRNFVGRLPLATGDIKEDFAKTQLYDFAMFLKDDEFWNAFITQIVVLPENEVKLIPLVGDQEIILGELDGYREKLDKLRKFYHKGLNEIGWNRYSLINLKYDKQVIGTKR